MIVVTYITTLGTVTKTNRIVYYTVLVIARIKTKYTAKCNVLFRNGTRLLIKQRTDVCEGRSLDIGSVACTWGLLWYVKRF